MEVMIEVDLNARKFFTQVDGKECSIDFQQPDSKTIELTHTQVPKELGGKGLAEKLTEYALQYAKENQLNVVPLCGYIQKYFSRHPELQDLLAQKK